MISVCRSKSDILDTDAKPIFPSGDASALVNLPNCRHCEVVYCSSGKCPSFRDLNSVYRRRVVIWPIHGLAMYRVNLHDHCKHDRLRKEEVSQLNGDSQSNADDHFDPRRLHV
jgi:hypothetical protein